VRTTSVESGKWLKSPCAHTHSMWRKWLMCHVTPWTWPLPFFIFLCLVTTVGSPWEIYLCSYRCTGTFESPCIISKQHCKLRRNINDPNRIRTAISVLRRSNTLSAFIREVTEAKISAKILLVCCIFGNWMWMSTKKYQACIHLHC
jgi:hypothetical protein